MTYYVGSAWWDGGAGVGVFLGSDHGDSGLHRGGWVMERIE